MMTQLKLFAWRKNAIAAPVATKAPANSDNALLELSRQLLIEQGANALAGRLVVRWNSRMRSTAGIAYPSSAMICLNPRLREFGDEEVHRTLRHELAHLLAYERAHRRRILAHGPEWKKACADLGLVNETRTHTLALPRRTVPKKHFYRCPACKVEIGRVKPLKRGSACLQCCRTQNRGHYDSKFRFVKV